MKSTANTLLISLAMYPGYVAAQENTGNAINGLTVLISWVVSTATTCIILGIIWFVNHRKRLKRKKREFTRNDSTRTTGATRTSVETDRASKYSRQESCSSSKPLMSGGDGVQYRPVVSRDVSRDAGPVNRRITGDVVAKWCNEHGLPEGTASILRENGFLTQDMIEALRPDDVPTLQLPTKAQEVQLRKVLEDLQAKKHAPQGRVTNGPVGKGRTRSRSEERKRSRGRSSSDYDVTNTTGPIQTSTPAPNTPLLDRSKSVNELDDTDGQLQDAYPGTRMRRSMEQLDDYPMNSKMGVILQAPRQNDSSQFRYPRVQQPNNPKGFNGLLSNAGLYDMAGHLGTEWLHLATMLGVPSAYQDRLRMDYPSNTKQQIYDMLRHWRDGSDGTKEQLKGELHTSLLQVNRTDLADHLLMEQVDGSNEKISKMTSLL